MFLTITTHFITNKWEYKEILISFEHVSSSYTSQRLVEIVLRILEEYQIQDQLFAITTNNASNNKTLQKVLQNMLLQKHQIRWDCRTADIPCLAHMLQLVVNKIIHGLSIQVSNTIARPMFDEKELGGLTMDHTFKDTIAKVSLLN